MLSHLFYCARSPDVVLERPEGVLEKEHVISFLFMVIQGLAHRARSTRRAHAGCGHGLISVHVGFLLCVWSCSM